MESLLSLFAPAVSPQLQEKLSSAGTTLLDVLDDDSCSRSYSARFDGLISFLTRNVSDLLRTALDLDDIPHSTKAFHLLSSPAALSRALLENDLLGATIARVLGGSPHGVVINRLAVIAGSVFGADPESAVRSGVSICGFLPFLRYRSVYEMFVGFGGDETKAQGSLKALNFVKSILDAIAALPSEGFDALQASALFRLVQALNATPAFAADIGEPSALAQLLRAFQGPPTALLNAQWAAVRTVVSDTNVHVLLDHIPQLIDLVEPSRPTYAAFQVAGLALLQKLITRDAGRSEIGGLGLAGTLASILQKFPKHTIAQSAVAALIIDASDFPDFGKPFLDAVISIAVTALDAETIEERGFAWALLRKVKGKVDVGEDVLAKVAEVDTIVERRYGGDPPTPPEAPQGGNANAQMMQLLMQLLMARK
jgi:hypothetical protein